MTLRALEEVRASIEAAGHDWTAKENSVSRRLHGLFGPEYDRQLDGLFGSQVDEASVAALLKERSLMALAPAPAAPPPAFDWRNARGADWTTPAVDQWPCNACVAFATCAVLESRLRIAANDPALAIDLSEADLFCQDGDCTSGWKLSLAIYRARSGICLEEAFPYKPRKQPCRPGVAPRVKVIDCATPVSEAERKAEIAAHGPITMSFNAYDDFLHYGGGVYRRSSNKFLYGHAVAVVGYSDDEQCWICKNSWGPGWGDRGYFKIGYGECAIEAREPGYGPTVVST